MSGDDPVIADTLKLADDACRVGRDEEKETDADATVETNVVIERC
jgi:hypothetical protein